MVIKCKMCGGDLVLREGLGVAVCEYCGSKQTLPRLDDERRVNLYDRANHFRRNNEFDKAAGIYEQILNEDRTDAEAYWSLVLCRYGIEYVEDPATRKRIPTINRTQFTSVFDDDNYKSALQYADESQHSIYEAEARAINEIQKGILAISQREGPFDVFICYKETDNNGRRTPDSVLANDLYHLLVQEGFKVFFSRITLEDKLGSAYEPYIFAALNSAKVMVVLGTRPDYFNAVWVKNEWSRYLALIRQGQKKVLIPAYRDMDPYDLPEEFSHLQAQDMSRLGFMQDLIRGIKKITRTDEPKPSIVKETVVTGSSANAAPLLRRAFIFLEDGEWSSADEYCEKVLDIDPENAEAYLGKLMVELRVRKREGLWECAEAFDSHNNYQKALRFADDELKVTLAGYIDHIKTHNLNSTYARALKAKSGASTEQSYKEAAELFERLGDYKDAAALAKECRDKAENAKKGAKRNRMAAGIVLVLLLLVAGFCFTRTKDVALPENLPAAEVTESAVVAPEKDESAVEEAETAILESKSEVEVDTATEQVSEEARPKRRSKTIYTNDNGTAALRTDGTAVFTTYVYDAGLLGAETDLQQLCIWKGLYLDFGNPRDMDFVRGLRTDGTLAGYLTDYAVENWTDIVALRASGRTVVGIRSDGTVVITGKDANNYGQYSVDDWTDIVDIYLAGLHTVGLRADGTVVATGLNNQQQCDVESWTDIVDVVAGNTSNGSYTIGIRSDGTVVTAGGHIVVSGSRIFELKEMESWTDIVDVVVHSEYLMGLRRDGTIVCLMGNPNGLYDVSDWTDIVVIHATGTHIVGLRKDGTVVATGKNSYGQCNVESWTDIVDIAVGREHTVGLRKDGTMVATGSNNYSQCDVEDWTNIKLPNT